MYDPKLLTIQTISLMFNAQIDHFGIYCYNTLI